MNIQRTALALFFAFPLLAAGPGGPAPGYVVDARSATIRPVLGLPGAMQLGPALDLPFGVASAAFSAAGTFAIAVTGATPPHAVVIGNLSGKERAVTDLGVTAPGARVLASNASGTAAAVYSSGLGELRFVSGLPSNPRLSDPVSTAALAGAITAAAMDDAGACLIAGTGALETICADGTASRVLPAASREITGIKLLNGGKDAVVADAASSQILSISNYASAPGVTVLASSQDGIQSPVGVEVISPSLVLAADSGAQAVFSVDTTGARALSSVPLNITPTRTAALTDRSVILLNETTIAPFTILDTTAMQTFFIPVN